MSQCPIFIFIYFFFLSLFPSLPHHLHVHKKFGNLDKDSQVDDDDDDPDDEPWL